MSDTVSDATEEPAAGVPAVRGQYHLGGPAATGLGLPFVGIAHARVGQGGGMVSWAQLQAEGIAEGDAFAFGGWLDAPERLAGVPCLLLGCRRLAYEQEEGSYRPCNVREIGDRQEGRPLVKLPDTVGADGKVIAGKTTGEHQAVDALLLVVTDVPFAATYRERLRAAIHHASTIVGPWLKRIAAAAPVAGLPAWARLAGRLRSEGKTARTSGRAYRRELLDLAPLTAPELARLAEWLRGPGVSLPATIEAWRTQAVAPPDGAGGDAGPDLGDQIPF